MESGFQQRLEAIRARMGAACERAGRDPASVRLLPVSKTFGPEAVREAAAAGLTVFGENKVQEARAKIPLCPDRLTWHLIGHLQSNKVRLAVTLFDTIQSVDSIDLAERIDAACEAAGRRMTLFVEINLAGEAAKSGVAPDDAPRLVERANALSRVAVCGLMAIPPFDPDPDRVRPYFRKLRELRDAVQVRTGTPLPELSMGMSHDFEAAIAEGATWIRVGTALFGAREKGSRP